MSCFRVAKNNDIQSHHVISIDINDCGRVLGSCYYLHVKANNLFLQTKQYNSQFAVREQKYVKLWLLTTPPAICKQVRLPKKSYQRETMLIQSLAEISNRAIRGWIRWGCRGVGVGSEVLWIFSESQYLVFYKKKKDSMLISHTQKISGISAMAIPTKNICRY